MTELLSARKTAQFMKFAQICTQSVVALRLLHLDATMAEYDGIALVLGLAYEV